MKRIYIHGLALFVLAFGYTKGTILSVLVYYIPFFAQVMIVGAFLIFLLFLAWMTRNEVPQQPISWKSSFKIAAFGSFFGYLLQLANIALYLKMRDIPIEMGLFEDELYRSVVFLFPLFDGCGTIASIRSKLLF
jgi:hypothetical protein